MLGRVIRVDQDVVGVRFVKVVKYVKKHFIHKSLESYWAVAKAKRYDFILVRPITHPKDCEFLRRLVHPYAVKGLPDVEFDEHLSTVHPLEGFFY